MKSEVWHEAPSGAHQVNIVYKFEIAILAIWAKKTFSRG